MNSFRLWRHFSGEICYKKIAYEIEVRQKRYSMGAWFNWGEATIFLGWWNFRLNLGNFFYKKSKLLSVWIVFSMVEIDSLFSRIIGHPKPWNLTALTWFFLNFGWFLQNPAKISIISWEIVTSLEYHFIFFWFASMSMIYEITLYRKNCNLIGIH